MDTNSNISLTCNTARTAIIQLELQFSHGYWESFLTASANIYPHTHYCHVPVTLAQ